MNGTENPGDIAYRKIMKTLFKTIIRENIFCGPAFSGAAKHDLETRFYDDAASEYDARFFSDRIDKHLPNRSAPLNSFLDYWNRDERDHYEFFATLYSLCGEEAEDREKRLKSLASDMDERSAEFSRIDRFFADEFSLCVLLAYDELMNTMAYKGEFDLYDCLGSTAISRCIRTVARDEAKHYAGALSLLKKQHRDRHAEVEKLLTDIVCVDTSGDPYAATFVLDRGDDMLNTAREQAQECADRVLRQLHRVA